MTQQHNYIHWQVKQDGDGILWLILDRADSSTNTLNLPVLEEFNHILDSVIHHQAKGLVISSGKSNGFIAGADVKQFAQIKDVNQAVELVREGQKLFERLANLNVPTVAMIRGFCLGGGLELALACDYRVAETDQKTRLGLPEVMLGIHPGWGGTVRLPKLIGALPALELILSGRTVSAEAAFKLGLVDAAQPLRQLERAARYFIQHKPATHQPSWWQKLLSAEILRPMIASLLRNQVKKKGIKEEHYPAPYAVIENWLQNGARSEKAYLDEANSIGKLLLSDTAKNLARVYFLQEKLKQAAQGITYKAQHVHVIGAGTMGGDIAAWCALKGLTVTLEDRNIQSIAPAIQRAHKLFKKRLKKTLAIRDAMDRLIPDPRGDGVRRADVIIEAVFEDLKVKQDLFKHVERLAKPDAILATNTSTLLIDAIAEVLDDPARLIGIHFFNPVYKMPLVEVIKDDKTHNKVIEHALAFVKQIDRLPIKVKSSPGFLVNRVLTPYLVEAWKLVAEGVPIAAVDKVAKQFGMPSGPIELADTVGLDVVLSASNYMSKFYNFETPKVLQEKVAEGKLGRKTDEGFYHYKNNKLVSKKLPSGYKVDKDVVWRLVMCFVNEAMACLREGIVEDADLLDAAIIFGTGFAPFRGGPIHYYNDLDSQQREEVLSRLSSQYGERFKIDEELGQAYS